MIFENYFLFLFISVKLSLRNFIKFNFYKTIGSYLYAEATNQDIGAKTQLKSVWFSSSVCIK